LLFYLYQKIEGLTSYSNYSIIYYMEGSKEKEISLSTKVPQSLMERMWHYTQKEGLKIKALVFIAIKKFLNEKNRKKMQ